MVCAWVVVGKSPRETARKVYLGIFRCPGAVFVATSNTIFEQKRQKTRDPERTSGENVVEIPKPPIGLGFPHALPHAGVRDVAGVTSDETRKL